MKRLLLIAVLSIFAANYTYAQSNQPSISDISNVNVDDLSDAQIASYMKKAQESGMSEQQLLLLAKQRGMSETQIQKLKNRISNSGLGGNGNKTSLTKGDIKRVRTDFQRQTVGDDIFEAVASRKAVPKSKIFGAEIFQNVNLNFEPSINTPTPQNYQIGSGDEVIIDIWGASEQSYILTISPDGLIKVPNLGPIYINGLSVEKAAKKVKYRLSKIYSGLYSRGEEEPNTYFQFSLGSLRSININVVGEAVYPGTFTLSSFSNMFNAIYYAGGPNNEGSMRNIELIRNNKKIANLDIYDYLLKGKLSNNEKLQDQDVILIHPYVNRINIKGQLKRVGAFETNNGESLSDLISFAGGFKNDAYQASIGVKRATEKQYELLSVVKDDFSTFEVKNGDEIEVKKILNKYLNRVQIVGAVNMPGDYELKEGLTLKGLIAISEGLREDAFIGRGLIIRLNDDLTLSNLSFKLEDIMSGVEKDILLKKEDVVKISSIFDISEAKTLSIRGEVLKSGDFPFINGMTVEDLILLSGGLKESASKSIVEVSRRIKNNSEELLLEIAETFIFPISKDLTISDKDSDFQLMPFDIVSVKKMPGYTKQTLVEIEGEVKYPGKYVLKLRDERISDIISRAGGLTIFSYPEGAQLIRKSSLYDVKSSDTDKSESVKKESFDFIENQEELVGDIVIKKNDVVAIDLVSIMKSPKSMGDLRLQEGDVISIPKRLETVTVRGEVLYPVTSRYQEYKTLRSYLSFAGGANNQSRIGKAFVIYPNGSAARTKRFLWMKIYPKIEPGSEIIIPRRPERKRISIQEILAIATSLTTMALLADRIGN